jgi:long-subunit fatty acid transport protein
VMWSAFTDYEIHTEIGADQVQVDDEAIAEETADLLSQDRLWARDNQDTYWLGVDAKARLMKKLTGGARVIYDHHAIPDSALSANNVDNDEVIVGLMTEVAPIDQLGIGLSFAHHFLMERTTTTSAFGLSLDDRKADRYFYPSANGTYGGAINRLGLTVRGRFGGDSL